jgi:hypothetical protein
MPEFTGQLGTPLRITLNSVLLECRWSHNEAMAGAEVTLLIHIGYAGDGNPVDYTIFQEGGGKIAQVKGKTFAGVAAAKWTIPDKVSGRLTFVAEAKDIDIVGKSDTLEVRSRAELGPAQAQDKDGAKLDRLQLGQKVTWHCRMPGIPEGTGYRWKIWCQLDPAHRQLLAAGFGEVTQSQGKVVWTSQFPGSQGSKVSQEELDRTSDTYKHATFQAHFECLAAVAKTDEVGIRTGIGFDSNTEGKRAGHLSDGKAKDLETNSSAEDLPVGSVDRDPATPDEGV